MQYNSVNNFLILIASPPSFGAFCSPNETSLCDSCRLVQSHFDMNQGANQGLSEAKAEYCGSFTMRLTFPFSGPNIPIMREYAVEDIAEKLAEKNSTAKYRVLYDGQCEICQACVAWLKTLDHENKTLALAISPEALSKVDSRLQIDECLRQLHVVTPEGEILVGWDAVAWLARLFPSTWLIGVLGQRFPFRSAGRLLYGFVAKNRYSLSKCRGGACRVAKPEAVRRKAKLGAFWSCYTLGFFIRLPLVLWSGIKAAIQRMSIFARTYHKRLDLLNGKLNVLFLNGFLPNRSRCCSANSSPQFSTMESQSIRARPRCAGPLHATFGR